MNIEVINACRAVRRYIDRVKNGDSPKNSWEEEVIAEIWERLCCYAPFDLSERKPEAITDIDSLEKQCELLEGLDERALKNEFVRVASMLPNYDDDPIAVVILPGDHPRDGRPGEALQARDRGGPEAGGLSRRRSCHRILLYPRVRYGA